MRILAFSDGEKSNKVAEVYDSDYACALLRGVLETAQENEKDISIFFVYRENPTIKESE